MLGRVLLHAGTGVFTAGCVRSGQHVMRGWGALDQVRRGLVAGATCGCMRKKQKATRAHVEVGKATRARLHAKAENERRAGHAGIARARTRPGRRDDAGIARRLGQRGCRERWEACGAGKIEPASVMLSDGGGRNSSARARGY